MTSGSDSGTNGGATRAYFLAVCAVAVAIAVVNSLTVNDDFAQVGKRLDAWEPWSWELTSIAFWIAAALPLLRLSRWLRPPRLTWPVWVVAHLLVSLPVCAVHVGWLVASRRVIYAALGSVYTGRFAGSQLLYEWRKDVLAVLAFAAVGYVADRLMAPVPVVTAPASLPFRLEVRDGTRTRWFAADQIERVEAAGNYVEVHTGDGPVLHRATLAAVEAELAPHGFARIHRSRLVRRNAVRAVASTPSGDFEVTLASGATVAGSRRYRAGL